MKSKNTNLWLFTLLSAAIVSLIPEAALASSSDGGPFADGLCTIAGWFQGNTGKAIATVAIIFLGIAAFFGKVTWGLALMFAVGIFAIFGAGEIVAAITSGADSEGGGCTI